MVMAEAQLCTWHEQAKRTASLDTRPGQFLLLVMPCMHAWCLQQVCPSCLVLICAGAETSSATRPALGTEAVAWMISSGLAADSDQAERLGNDLLQKGLLFEVSYKHQFRDKPYLYQ